MVDLKDVLSRPSAEMVPLASQLVTGNTASKLNMYKIFGNKSKLVSARADATVLGREFLFSFSTLLLLQLP